MQPIHKNSPLIDLDEWVERNLTPNNIFLALRNCNSEKKAAFWWKKLSNTGVWGKLKNHLLQEQGFICCYCGGRIGEHTMEVEHFYPKSNGVYVGLMFTYENLFASCSTPKIHVVKGNETIEDIAKYYGIGVQNMVAWIEKEPIRSGDIVEIGDKIEITTTNKKHEVVEGETLASILSHYQVPINKVMKIVNREEPITNTTKLGTGQKLLIKEGRHCNNFKLDKEITSFHLLDSELLNQFDLLDDGTIQANKELPNHAILDYEINHVLNLNVEELKRIRREILRAYNEVILSLSLPTIQEQKNYYVAKQNGRFEAYHFVYLYFLHSL